MCSQRRVAPRPMLDNGSLGTFPQQRIGLWKSKRCHEINIRFRSNWWVQDSRGTVGDCGPYSVRPEVIKRWHVVEWLRLIIGHGLLYWAWTDRGFIYIAHQSQSYVTTDGQSASLSWNRAPIWGLRPDLYYCVMVTGLLMWGAHSDERAGLLFARVKVSSNKSVVSMYNLHFTCYWTYICMYV
jgi:hypothetical protein